MTPTRQPPHTWKFFRTGGIDQVALESADDLLALRDLDQELWVALSCPVKGLELSERTLALIDLDRDGRIGVPEVLAAVEWATSRLADPGQILRASDSLPIAAIREDTPEGKVIRAAARQILAGVGRKDAVEIRVDDATDTARIFAASPLNGDGIIPEAASEDPAVQQLIRDILATVGGSARASGTTGVTAEKIDRFFAEAQAYVAWSEQQDGREVEILGDGTDAAYAALAAVRAKVDDFFTRCRVAEYDPRAASALNRAEADFLPFAARTLSLSAQELLDFPLAKIEAGAPLPLDRAVNPAWSDALQRFRELVVAPLLGPDRTTLALDDWTALCGRFGPYAARLAGKGDSAVQKLGLSRIREILGGTDRAALAALVERDRALEPEFKALGDVERLVRYNRDLRTLLHNFVNFADFYSPDRLATFQAGTLILDSRSTELCIRTEGSSPLAAMTKMCIVNCTCTKAGGGATQTIAACFTQGDSDYLFVGRNGIFYDRAGELWYAVITGIADNPISLGQAFWSPYKKFMRFVEAQIAKRAAAEEAETGARLNAAVGEVGDATKPSTPPQKFDLALITGIGVAIGSIGGFITGVFTKVVDIPVWHLPLILVGLMLVISLPSVLIAAFKLRERTLGPLLEANGWAINGRVKINIPFGVALTKVAALPPGARRSLEDPYEDKTARRRKRRALGLTVLVLLLGAALAVRWAHNRTGRYFWEPAAAPSK